MTLCSCMILSIKVLGKGRHNDGKVLQSSGCRNLPFTKQVNVPREIDQRVWPLFPTALSAWKDSGKILKFIFILSAKFWHLEIKLIWQSPSPSFLEVLMEWCLLYLKCCPFTDLLFCLMSVTSFASCYFSAHLWYIFLWDCHAFISPLPPCSSQEMSNFQESAIKLMIFYTGLWNWCDPLVCTFK